MVRRIYKQPTNDIKLCFSLFYICVVFISYGYVYCNIDIIKLTLIILAVAELACIGAELELREM